MSAGLNRRDFLRASALGVVVSAVPHSFAWARPAADGFRVLRRNVGIFTARGGTIGWLANPEGAVVVDSQYADTAALCLDGLRERGARSVDALVNTHHHGDHTAGNAVFRGATREIVAHRRAAELQRAARVGAGDEEAAERGYPDRLFEDEWTLEVGDETIRARHYGPAHTGGDCTVHFEQAGVVHMGDLVFNRAYPFIDRPGGASVRGWVALMEAVAAEHPADTLFVFGHATEGHGVTGGRQDILLQRDFLSALLETASQAISEGKSREELMRMERLPGFPEHTALVERLSLGAGLGVAYDELAG